MDESDLANSREGGLADEGERLIPGNVGICIDSGKIDVINAGFEFSFKYLN